MKVTARAAACVLLLPGYEAFAFFNDHLQLSASEHVTHDNNLFRLSSDVDPVPIIGTNDLSDTYRTTAVGLVFNVPTGAQTFRGSFEINRNDFDHFTDLDFDGHRASVDWAYDGERLLKARAGRTDSRSLASFSNVQNGVQSTEPNVIDTSRTFANATVAVAPHWQLMGEVARSTQDDSAAAYKPSDLRATAAKVEFAYVTNAMSKMGIDLQSTDATLPNPQPIGPVLVDNSYVEQDAQAFLQWKPRDSSSLEARVGQMRRTYADLAARRGQPEGTYLLSYGWQPVTALSLTASVKRGPSTIEQVNVGYVLLEGLGLQAQWQLTDNIALTFGVERGNRTYRDDPSVALGLIPQLTERVTVGSVGGNFKLSRVVALDFFLHHDRRTSSAPDAGYNAGVAGLGVRCSF